MFDLLTSSQPQHPFHPLGLSLHSLPSRECRILSLSLVYVQGGKLADYRIQVAIKVSALTTGDVSQSTSNILWSFSISEFTDMQLYYAPLFVLISEYH
jgi:hypothetical protein